MWEWDTKGGVGAKICKVLREGPPIKCRGITSMGGLFLLFDLGGCSEICHSIFVSREMKIKLTKPLKTAKMS